MVVDWEQETGLLMSSGDVRIVRIWDADRETKVQVITVGPWVAPFAPLSQALHAPLHKTDLQDLGL
jgi:hypothetical protein